MQQIEMGTAGIIDVETTGVNPWKDQIVELCLLLFTFDIETGHIGEVLEEYVGRREPTCAMQPCAVHLHGLTQDILRGENLDFGRLEVMLAKPQFLVAHNASFDRGFVTRILPDTRRINWYCSMSGIDWKGKGFARRGLQYLLQCHGIDPGRAHRAQADVRATLQLLAFRQPPTGQTYLSELLRNYKYYQRALP